MGLLDILSGASGGLANAAKARYELDLQEQERARTQALADADLALKLGDQSGLMAALKKAGINADPSAYFKKLEEDRALSAQKLKAEQEAKQTEQAKGILGLLLQNKQYDAANDLAQSNNAIRRLSGLAPGMAGPVNLGFAAPPASPEAVLRANTQKDVAKTRAEASKATAQTRAQATKDAAQTRAGATVQAAKTRQTSQKQPSYQYFKDSTTGQVMAINRANPNDRRLIDPEQIPQGEVAQTLTPAQQAIVNALKPKR